MLELYENVMEDMWNMLQFCVVYNFNPIVSDLHEQSIRPIQIEFWFLDLTHCIML
jgi:hypothetical protein